LIEVNEPGPNMSEEGDRPGIVHRAAPLLGLLLLALFYLLTAPTNRTEAEDAFWYAWDVETLPWSGLLHPHHMLYLPFERIAWLGTRILGLAERSYPVMVVAGAIAAAVALVVLWDMLVRRLEFDRGRAAAAVGLLAFTYGFWRYSAEAEVYALATAWSAILLHLALSERPGRGEAAALVIFGATAPLVHILTAPLAGIAVPVAVAMRRGLRSAAAYVLAAGTLGLALAAAGYRIAGRTAGGMLDYYMGGQAPEVAGGAASAFAQIVAIVQSVVPGNFLLTFPSFRSRLSSWFPARMISEEAYAGEHASVVVGILGAATLLLLFAAAFRFFRGGARRPDGGARRAALTVAAVWFLLYACIGLLFSRVPNAEIWILALPPAWLLIVTLFVADRRPSGPLIALVLALFAHNLIGGLWIYYGTGGDRARAKGEWLIENSRAADAILTADSRVFARYLRYWAPGTVLDLQGLDEAELARTWDEALARSGSVFATHDVFEPPEFYLVQKPVEARALSEFGREVRQEFEQISQDEFGGVWQHAGPSRRGGSEDGPP
jgi:hypothetical protein